MKRLVPVVLAAAVVLGATAGCKDQASKKAETASAPAQTAATPPPSPPTITAPNSPRLIPEDNLPTKPAPAVKPVVGKEFTTASGLKYVDLVIGKGPSPKPGQSVTVQYTGTLTDGTKFDSSRDPGHDPFTFLIGTHQVIDGWDEGVMTMKVGGRRKLTIPANLAYGDNSPSPKIPPGSVLLFDIELVGVH